MNRATIATLALGAAMQFPNWAAAHVLRLDDVQPSQLTNDEYEELRRDFLPIVHECPQVAVAFRVTFRAQEMPEDGFDTACNLLKETEDVFTPRWEPILLTSSRARLMMITTTEWICWFSIVEVRRICANGGRLSLNTPPLHSRFITQGGQ